MHKQQLAVLGLGAACRCLISLLQSRWQKVTLFTYVVSQLYIYSFLARSASYWTVHQVGDSKNPKQHLTTEDWAQYSKKIL